ncbi:MAG: hydroxymethylbilane synthase [Alphaproteobacteria bacterium]|jgi:hydroxymethylbilane synthase|nr:hydroxymethylbilane synthase [Alphaproteobacteria bacterium]
MTPLFRIGTRGSPLAQAQARAVRDALAASHPDLADPAALEIVVIRTTGDRVLDRPLAEIGGKGLFTKEIEEALQAGAIDLAVHSMKDVPTVLPDGLVIDCLLPREDPRDAWFAGSAMAGPAALPPGARVGTAALRRKAQLLAGRPDLRIDILRGNVATRLRKLEEGVVDATMLAVAGLKRLGRADLLRTVLEPVEMLPAVGQGAIGVECRADDTDALTRLAALGCAATARAVACERALLAGLDGSCRTPIAALAVAAPDGGMALDALLAAPDGRWLHRTARTGLAADALRLGADAAAELRARAGPDYQASWRAG